MDVQPGAESKSAVLADLRNPRAPLIEGFDGGAFGHQDYLACGRTHLGNQRASFRDVLLA
jgi:hypothetical protein